MVETSTYDPSKISIWASKDSSDPNKLKLRITNLTNQPIAAPIVLKGFSGTSAEAYVLSSTNPTDTSAASTKSSAPTTINGYSVDGSDVEGSFQNIQPNDVQISGSTFTYTMPAYSSAAIIVNGS